ncbi:hypothetical protein JCM19238_3530 [Vibrio ponticus]|nr:hypothetical protein JCM19238_3530 [Vibrio ponticus]
MYKLVALDMDGTLLNSQKAITLVPSKPFKPRVIKAWSWCLHPADL